MVPQSPGFEYRARNSSLVQRRVLPKTKTKYHKYTHMYKHKRKEQRKCGLQRIVSKGYLKILRKLHISGEMEVPTPEWECIQKALFVVPYIYEIFLERLI